MKFYQSFAMTLAGVICVSAESNAVELIQKDWGVKNNIEGTYRNNQTCGMFIEYADGSDARIQIIIEKFVKNIDDIVFVFKMMKPGSFKSTGQSPLTVVVDDVPFEGTGTIQSYFRGHHLGAIEVAPNNKVEFYKKLSQAKQIKVAIWNLEFGVTDQQRAAISGIYSCAQAALSNKTEEEELIEFSKKEKEAISAMSYKKNIERTPADEVIADIKSLPQNGARLNEWCRTLSQSWGYGSENKNSETSFKLFDYFSKSTSRSLPSKTKFNLGRSILSYTSAADSFVKVNIKNKNHQKIIEAQNYCIETAKKGLPVDPDQ